MSTSRWLSWTPGDSVIEKGHKTDLTKPTEGTFVSFVSPNLPDLPIVGRSVSPAAEGAAFVFPHCPRCASFALYRPNNMGSYECQTCGLQAIAEHVARRTQ